MSFATYFLYIVFTYLRPFDAYFPELGAGRPMIWRGIFALLLAGASALARRDLALQGRHFLPLLLMVVTNATSEISSGNGGVAAMATDADFSPAVFLFVLTAMNITTARRMQFVCVSVLLCVVFLSMQTIVAYHTGFTNSYCVRAIISKRPMPSRQKKKTPRRRRTCPARSFGGSGRWVS